MAVGSDWRENGRMSATHRSSGKSGDHAGTIRPLAPEQLRWICPPEHLPFQSTADVAPVAGVVGQDPAVDALRFGLETNAYGQNIFVRGLVGTGRLTLVRSMLEEVRLSCPRTRDHCYVYNFAQPDRPRALTLPRGQARDFRRRMDGFADFIRDDLGSALSSEAFRHRQSALERETQRQLDEIVQPFMQALSAAGLTMVSVGIGAAVQPAIVPAVDGKPVSFDEFERLRAAGKISPMQYSTVRERLPIHEKQLEQIAARVNEVRRRLADASRALLDEFTRHTVTQQLSEIRAVHSSPAVGRYLDEVINDVVDHIVHGRPFAPGDDRRYRVNVVSDNPGAPECPIIIENSPTISNLLGTIDYEVVGAGVVRSDHLSIRPGSLLRADGGYLILEARDVLNELGAWKILVRTLRAGRLEVTPPEMAYPFAPILLKPEPIELNIKVILLGDASTFYLLDSFDPDFPHLFKVLADFDSVLERNADGIRQYAGVVAKISRDEGLPPFDRTAIAALTEHGARIAAREGKLTTRFGRLADIAREAAFIARKRGRERVEGGDVVESVRRTRARADLPSRTFREMVAKGLIRIQVEGSAVGQINGLAVLQAGNLTYGFPARITATIGAGTAGVINIEGAAELSGSMHTKGFYILGGCLRHLLRTDHPLAFDASIAFEQSYGGIDGDSASGAEICCLLSALTDVPLRQDLAMTGAIDQHGHILAVGGVNEKVEGFFDSCRDLKPSCGGGVIIPAANAGDLMLRPDVVDACRAGQFQVYAVATVHEALALLTGRPTGERGSDGQYSEGTLLHLAVARAREYWRKAAQTPIREG